MLLRVRFLALCASIAFVFCLMGPTAAAVAQSAGKVADPAVKAAYLSDPKFQAALQDAAKLYQAHRFSFAAGAYKRANKIAGGGCWDCLRGEYSAQMSCGEFKAAAEAAQEMEGVASGPASKSLAEFRRASALYEEGGEKPKADKLETIHGLLQEAITNYPKSPAALFLDGKVLAQMGKAEEARADFTQCVKCVGTDDPARLRAQHFADNPELSLHKMAPAFEVTALDGSKFNLDAMGGRVVLIDFWATWCGPCNEELPHMKQIAREFAGQPLVIISVSWDDDEGKWKEFLARHEMTWIQYRDADHRLSDLFGVHAIPHYFTIDSDGVLTAEMLGSGSDVEGKLKKLIARARQAPTQTVASAADTN